MSSLFRGHKGQPLYVKYHSGQLITMTREQVHVRCASDAAPALEHGYRIIRNVVHAGYTKYLWFLSLLFRL
jgi:hypothetical protein